MLNGYKVALNRFLLTIPDTLRDNLYTIVFYSAWLVVTWVSMQDFTLSNFDGRIVSAATLNRIDSGHRTLTALLAFPMLAAIVAVVTYILYKVKLLPGSISASVEKSASIVGCLIFLSYIFIPQSFPNPLLLVIFSIHLLLVISRIIYSKRSEYLMTAEHFSWLLVTAFGLTTYLSSIAILHKTLIAGPYHATLLFILVEYALFAASYLFSRLPHAKNTPSLRTTLIATAPMAAAGLLPFLCQEFYLIFNQHEISLPQPDLMSLAGFFILLFTSLFLYVYKRKWKVSPDQLIEKYFFPLVIVSISLVLWYRPIVSAPTDLFEPANSALMIQQYFEYGKIPFFETFNAHAFSDALWGFIYSAINGYSATGWTHYDFLQRILELLIAYFFIKRLSRNAYIAVGTILVLPALTVLFPPAYSIALLPLAAGFHLFRSKRLIEHLLFTLMLPLLVFFRIDIGFSVVAAAFTIPILNYLSPKYFWLAWKKLLSASIGTVTFILLFIFAVLSVRGISALPWLHSLLHILDSNQAFAYPTLWNNFDRFAVWNFFLAPFILTICCFVTLILVRFGRFPNGRFVAYSFVFLSAFSLSNLALRGTVRHNLFENSALVLSVFIPLLISMLIFFSAKKRGIHMQFLLLSFASTLIIHQFVLVPNDPQTPPIQKDRGMLTEAFSSLNTIPIVRPDHRRIERGIVPKSVSTSSKEFRLFVQSELDCDETFFDFSNNPMLYIYTHKETPFYTNHIMLAHDDYLQKQAISYLQNFDIPVLIYSDLNPYNLDYVPFQFRYFLLSEYFYDNYHPYAIMDNREIWIRNDWNPHTPDYMPAIPIQSSTISNDVQIKYLPFVWGAYDSIDFNSLSIRRGPLRAIDGTDKSSTHKYLFEPLTHDEKRGGTYILIDLSLEQRHEQKDQEIAVEYGEGPEVSGAYRFRAIADGKAHRYIIRASAEYAWKEKANNWIVFRSDAQDASSEIINVSILQAD